EEDGDDDEEPGGPWSFATTDVQDKEPDTTHAGAVMGTASAASANTLTDCASCVLDGDLAVSNKRSTLTSLAPRRRHLAIRSSRAATFFDSTDDDEEAAEELELGVPSTRYR